MNARSRPTNRTEAAKLRRVLAALACWTLAVTGLARASEPPPSSPRWLRFSALAGSTQPDLALADYQWDTRPHLAWGMKATAGAGRWGGGARMWRSHTTQSLSGAGMDPSVNQTRAELVGSVRVLAVRNTELQATAGGGWMRLAYDPEEMTLDTGAGSTVVRFAPIHEWIYGAGFAVSRPIAGAWRAGLETEWRRFALDTAHRSGTEIVLERTAFDEWSARFELAWTRGW